MAVNNVYVVFIRIERLDLKHQDDIELWWADVLGGGVLG